MVAIFVICTIVISICIEYIVQRSRQRRTGTVPAIPRAVSSDKFLLPRGYFFNRGHAWIEVLFSGNARVGIDDFVQKIVGTINTIAVPQIGAEIRQGDLLFTIQQDNRTLSFTAPISGKIIECNTALLQSPSLLKSDPYFEGWVVMIEPRNIASEIRLLAVADEAAEWLRHELRRFRDFITSAPTADGVPALSTVTLHDGGMPMHGVLERVDEHTWESFQQQFLNDVKRK
jgi:glycine cleavage system H protein